MAIVALPITAKRIERKFFYLANSGTLLLSITFNMCSESIWKIENEYKLEFQMTIIYYKAY